MVDLAEIARHEKLEDKLDRLSCSLIWESYRLASARALHPLELGPLTASPSASKELHIWLINFPETSNLVWARPLAIHT
jgi:hypothetical protein